MAPDSKKDPKEDPKGDPDDDEEEEDDDDDGDEDPPEPKVVKISQDRLDKQLARSHNKGKRDERKAILKELGVTDLDEVKTKIAAKDKDDDDKSTEDKEKAAKDKADAAKATAEANKTKAEAKIEKILLRNKVKDSRLDRAVKLIDPEEHLESDEDEILEAVESLMEDMPEMFKGEDDEDEDEDPKPKKRPARKSTTGGPPRKKKGPSAQSKVQDRLQKRHGAKLQKKDQ